MATGETPDDPTPETDGTATDPPETEKDWRAEYEKLQRNSRKWEERAKVNADAARQLDELRKQTESDQERAVREAVEVTRSAVRAEMAADRVADAFRVAAARTGLAVDDVLDGINVARFIDEEGRPDREAIERFVERITPTPSDPAPATVDLGQGARGTVPLNSSQLQRDLEKALSR